MRARRALDAALRSVERFEADVHAFAHLDAVAARDEALEVDARADAPLTGVILGVKDVIDTADMPTEYGSPIYRGFRPAAEAAVVTQLRAAGATLLGKTVTAEFAATHPGPTRNPCRLAHTPGGSSMGSAAAVATGMVDLALGTQTAGSVLRPASFCGVYGFKPSYGTVSVAGVKLHAPSLDTVGWLARDPALLAIALAVLTGRPVLPALSPEPLRIGLWRGEHWFDAEIASRAAVEMASQRLRRVGAIVEDRSTPAPFIGLTEHQQAIQSYEAARSFASEYEYHRDQLSRELQTTVELGRAVPVARYDAARHAATLARAAEDELFGSASALLAPLVVGEAPEGLASTGNPLFCRLFTLLGTPTLAIPGRYGNTGLPIGVQLVGRVGDDARLLAIGRFVGELLRDR